MKKFTVSLLLLRNTACWEDHFLMKISFTVKGKKRIKLLIYYSIPLVLDNQNLTLPIYWLFCCAGYHHGYPKNVSREGVNLFSWSTFDSSKQFSFEVSICLPTGDLLRAERESIDFQFWVINCFKDQQKLLW